jgi:hypothetical protein
VPAVIFSLTVDEVFALQLNQGDLPINGVKQLDV